MNELISRDRLAELKTFIGHFNRKNSYRVINVLHRHPEGITASEIILKLRIEQSEASSTLRLLYRYGFATAEREGKYIIYAPVMKKFALLAKLNCIITKSKHYDK